MNANPVTPQQAIQYANEAFHRGDRRSARQWAQFAASVAPQNEEAWLILAAVSTPQASLAYMQQALRINPTSERALRGLHWAQNRLGMQETAQQRPVKPSSIAPLATTQPVRRQAAPIAARQKASGRKWGMLTVPVIFLVLVIFAALIMIPFWPGTTSHAQALIPADASPTADGPSWSVGNVAKPSYTPAATATAIPTATFTPTALPTDTPAPMDEPASAGQVPANGKYILVSISEQHLYAYQDNKLVYSFIASTGMHNATRTGTFQVLDKIPNAYGATWDLWMPNWMGIYYSGTLENGIHALPILSNGTQLWAGYLGTPISFGCVVLGVQEAQMLYDWADVGTTVEIKY